MKNSDNKSSKELDKNQKDKSLEARAAETKTAESSSKNKDLSYNPDVTKHDLDILRQENVHGDGGDDQQLREREHPVDFAGEDLDIPGRNQARKWDQRGLPDEENKLYSQGGEDKNNLEEDSSAL